jgi:outer membrane protein OmpA-like peptidoglycan-associated protein
MNSQQDDNLSVVRNLLIVVVLFAVALAVGVGLYKAKHKKAPAAKPAATAPAAAASGAAAPAGDDVASVKVENGVVKFYFASGKADVAAGAQEALADVVKAVAAGKKAAISGFHDASGDPAKNAELAKQRAIAVRDALKALGVAEDKVELKKPEQAQATGPAAEARRVEVSVQ